MRAFAKTSTTSASPHNSNKDGNTFFGIQAKLKVGKPGDKYEQEADHVADKVVKKTAKPATKPKFFNNTTDSVQKKSKKEDEKPIAQTVTKVDKLEPKKEKTSAPKQDKEKEFKIQKKENPELEEENLQMQSEEGEEELQTQLDPEDEDEHIPLNKKEEQVQMRSFRPASSSINITQNLRSSRGGGRPLPPTTRSQMESGFGTDFSAVRIHTDSTAVTMTQNVGAQAFASGADIYFNAGRYNPGTTTGDTLLAHELTHTIQQGAIAPDGLASQEQASQNIAQGENNTATDNASSNLENSTATQTATPNTQAPPVEEAIATPENTEAEEVVEQDTVPRSPEEDPAFNQAQQQIEQRANAQQTTEPANAAVSSAQRSSPVPANERQGSAQANQVETMSEQEPGSFDAEAFKARLMERIEAMQLPANEEEADDFENNNNIDEVSQAGTAMASQERDQAAGPIEQSTTAEPNTEAIPERQVTPLPDPPIGSEPRPVPAAAAMPRPRPNAEVSQPLQENMQDVDQEMADNEVTDEMLANSNEPSFTGALASKNEAQEHTEQAPHFFREEETQSLAQRRQNATNQSEQNLEEMHGDRATALNTVLEQQQNTATTDSAERARIAGEINTIYENTKTDVETILAELDTKVTEKFEAAAKRAKTAFENYVERKMDAYKDERYSGIGGAFTWVGDAFTGLPDEVNQFFVDGRELYIDKMDGELTKISTYIAEKLTAAKNRITTGKNEVTSYVESLPESLQDIGQEAADDVQQKFDDLSADVDSKQDELIDSLAQQYQSSLEEVDARIEEMKAANRGLIDMVFDAIAGVIATIISIKNMLTNLLSAALEAIGAIIMDPIGFLSNLIRGVKEGFLNFGANIMTHLISGLVTWITGALGPMGITIPDDIFSLKGIFSLVMQVLGLTWDYMRQKAVRLLGEPVVQALELGFEMFQILRTEGVAGIWEYIKEQFNDLKETVIDSIKEMIISQVVDAGIKWVLGLLSPAGAFVKAAMMIIDIVKFFIERGSQIIALVNAFIDAIRAVAASNVSVIATKIEDALARAVPVIIGLLASILGISDLAKKVQNIIKRIRRRIDKAIDKLILKAKTAFKRLVRSGRARVEGAISGLLEWWKKKKEFTAQDGESHALYFAGNGDQAELTLASTPTRVKTYLTQNRPDLQAKDATSYAAALEETDKLEGLTDKANTENQKDDQTEKDKLETKITQSLDKLKQSLAKLMGDHFITQYVGDKVINIDASGTSQLTATGEAIKTKSEGNANGYSFAVTNGKHYIRRKNAEDTPQVSIDGEGKLQLGGASGSSDPEHSNYIPDTIDKKESGMGYEVTYTTKTDEGNPGPNFKINISHAGVLRANENARQTRHVSGSNLKLKNTGGARGRTDSATAGFHNAHLIADRFGGSGSNTAMNIHPSSPSYNTRAMKGKEDLIARVLQDNPDHDQGDFTLDVSAELVEEKTTSQGLIDAINEEAQKDNTEHVSSIEEALERDLLSLVRPDLEGLPAKFESVNYDLEGVRIRGEALNETGERIDVETSLGEDPDYDRLILETIKRT